MLETVKGVHMLQVAADGNSTFAAPASCRMQTSCQTCNEATINAVQVAGAPCTCATMWPAGCRRPNSGSRQPSDLRLHHCRHCRFVSGQMTVVTNHGGMFRANKHLNCVQTHCRSAHQALTAEQQASDTCIAHHACEED